MSGDNDGAGKRGLNGHAHGVLTDPSPASDREPASSAPPVTRGDPAPPPPPAPGAPPIGRADVPPPPDAIRDLAEGCVRFVEKAVGVKLDFTPETLPLLDHYLEQARAAALERPETIAVIANATGAYVGEVIRRRYPSWWRCDGDEPAVWQVELEQVYLAIRPIGLVHDALTRGLPSGHDGDPPETDDIARFELEEEDKEAIAARLGELPAVPVAEFYAPSTRVEVIDIVVDAIRSRRMAANEGEAFLRPEDYERE